MKIAVFAILLLLFTGCSDNSIDAGNYNGPCAESAETILDLPGSPDAPVLYSDKQEREPYIYWTEIEGAFYELQACYYPCFDSMIYTYAVYTNFFPGELMNCYYYRVRALSSGYLTGWSNVVSCSYGAKL